ncbi:MAG: tetratricopeptide repeat protein [Cytophagales bacterium]|nr:MAG: tetratricopeptide repeat protein [Cytophagales bacterium]
MPQEDNYYQILGLSQQANREEIKNAYRMLALRYHPDRNPDNPTAEEIFKKINEAYQVLSNENKKYYYDLGLYRTVYYANTQTEYAYYRQQATTPQDQPTPDELVWEKTKKRFNAIGISLFIAFMLFGWFFHFLMNRFTAYYHYQRAVYFYEQGLVFESLVSLSKSSEFSRHLPEVFTLRAQIYIKEKGDYASALVNYEKAIEIAPHDATLFYWRGICFLQEGYPLSAIRDFNEAITLDDTQADFYRQRGKAFVKKNKGKKTPQACQDFTKARNLGSQEAYQDFMSYCQ